MKFQFVRDFVYALPVSKALQEVILSLIRIALVAAVSAVLAALPNIIKTMPTEWQLIATAILTVIGIEWDKYKFIVNTENRVKGVNNYGLIGY